MTLDLSLKRLLGGALTAKPAANAKPHMTCLAI
jgi:hypothetical protein